MGFIFSAEKVVFALLLIFICLGIFGSSNAQLLSLDEVQTLETIFTKLQNRTVNIKRTSCTDGNWNFASSGTNAPTSNITCDCTVNASSVCRVTRIQLKSLSLPGIFPPEFGNLTGLREIDLSRNFLNGTIPATLSQIPLEILSVIGNRLSGPIPPELGEITSLTELNLESNMLTGPKYSLLAWLAIRNRLTTGDRMLHWSHGINSSCVFCSDQIESRDHLFFTCRYSKEVWTGLTRKLLARRFTTRWDKVLKTLTNKALGKDHLFLVRYTFQITVHTIWRERNQRRHGETPTTTQQMIRILDKQVRNRISSISELGDRRYDHCMEAWFASR